MNFAALSAFAEEFMALRSAVARRDPHRNNRDRISLKHREQLLRSFIAYWHEHGGQWPIRSSLLLDWVAVGSDRQHPSRDQRRFYVARSFLQQVRVLEPATEIPENIYRPLYRRRTPYLFSDQETVRLMDAVSQLRLCDILRPYTFYTLIGLLASTGLRIGEAIALAVEDVRLDATPPYLLVHESKFGKSRYVVLHPSTAVDVDTGPSAYIFVVGALVYVLKPPPATDVVNQQLTEVGMSGFCHCKKLLKLVSSGEGEAALSRIGMSGDDLHPIPLCIAGYCVRLVLR